MKRAGRPSSPQADSLWAACGVGETRDRESSSTIDGEFISKGAKITHFCPVLVLAYFLSALILYFINTVDSTLYQCDLFRVDR